MKKYSMETMVGIFVVAGLLCVGYLTVKLGKVSFLGQNTYPLSARFTSVSGLRMGSSVEIYGIQVGTVTSLVIDWNNQMAVVGMGIQRQAKIYDDGTATIQTTGLIGDKHVKIDPGGAGALLKPGGVITQTSVPPDIEDLIGRFAFGSVSNKDQEKPAK